MFNLPNTMHHDVSIYSITYLAAIERRAEEQATLPRTGRGLEANRRESRISCRQPPDADGRQIDIEDPSYW